MNNQEQSKIKRFIGPSILILIGSYMLNLSWFKWPDLLIDYGRELYVPWQITQGKVLFADINHLYGPLSHYFNAFLFQIFGTGLSTLAYFNIVIVILLTSFIYTLIKSSFGDLIATTASIFFLVIFAFSQYVGIANYNFVCPYSHEVTYGIFLFFLALFIFKKYITDLKLIYAALIGFILGLIFLTKVEIFLAGFISILFGLISIFWQLKPPHPQKHLFNLIFFFLLPVVAFFIYFSLHMPLFDALNSVIASYKNIFIDALAGNIYYQHISGFDNPLKNITLMLKYTFYYLMFFIFIGFVSYLFARSIKRKPVYGAIIIIIAVLILIFSLGFFSISWLDIARPYPVFILILFAYLINNLIIKREDKTFIVQHLPFILLVIFSLLLLLKMILNVRLYHYGFALAMPASLVMVTVLLYYIPALISRWGSHGYETPKQALETNSAASCGVLYPPLCGIVQLTNSAALRLRNWSFTNKTVAMGFTGLFILFTIFFYFSFTKQVYDMKNYPIAEGRDRFFTFDADIFNYGSVVNKTLEYIDKSMTRNDTFIVMPDGVMLNYLSRRRNPSRYFEFTPNFVEATGEEKIINDIYLNHPSFIILSKKNTSEHGAKYFGADYALNIYSWITNNYDRVMTLGNGTLAGDDFGIIIYKKKY